MNMGVGTSCELNLNSNQNAFFMPLHCQGLAPRWASNAGLGARGLRPCALRNYLKPKCGEHLGIGWKWPCTRPKSFHKENFICIPRKCNTINGDSPAISRRQSCQDDNNNNNNINKGIGVDEKKLSRETSFGNILNNIDREILKKSSINLNKKSEDNGYISPNDNLTKSFDRQSQLKDTEESEDISNDKQSYIEEEIQNDENIEVYEDEIVEKKFYNNYENEQITHNIDYQGNQDEHISNLNNVKEEEYQENYESLGNACLDPNCMPYIPLTPEESDDYLISDHERGWSQSPSTPDRVIFPQETRQAIRQEFNEMLHNQINPKINIHPISPVSSPRIANYDCMCHLQNDQHPPILTRTYDICQTDYDWDGTPHDLTTSHGYDQCCDEDSINYRTPCRGSRLQQLVDLFENIGDGRVPPPPPTTPTPQETYFIPCSPRKCAMIASPEQPKRHKRRRRHKKKAHHNKGTLENDRYHCPAERLEWPIFHRCERCEWLHSRM